MLEILCSTPIEQRAIFRGQWMALRKKFLWPTLIIIAAYCVGWHMPAFVDPSKPMEEANLILIIITFDALKFVADLFALAWMGMWVGLTSKRATFSTALTVLLVLIIPQIAPCIPTLAVDAFWVLFGQAKVREDFRTLAAMPSLPKLLAPLPEEVPAVEMTPVSTSG
jgi:hypothetical protein